MNRLLAVILLQGLMVVGGAEAAGTKQKKTALTPQHNIKKSNRNITHPCARQSATQLNRRALPFLNSIQIHAKRYGVDSDLVKSVITVESCYKRKARSPKGAQGLMQLIPATADRFGIADPYDSHQNIKGGARYLAWLSKRFKGDLTKVLAAYNAGEGKVDRYNGIPPYRETRNYVHDVLAVYNKLKKSTRDKQLMQQQKALAARRPLIIKPINQQQPASAVSKHQQQQRQLQARQQQLRQIQIRKQLLQQQARLRQQQQHLRAQFRQRQQARNNGMVEVIGKPGKPIYETAPQQTPPQRQAHIVIGKPPIKQAVARKPVAQAQRPVVKPVVRPILHQAATRVAPNSLQQAQPLQGGRVRSVFSAPFKPGRGGWQANKALAPQLYKQ